MKYLILAVLIVTPFTSSAFYGPYGAANTVLYSSVVNRQHEAARSAAPQPKESDRQIVERVLNSQGMSYEYVLSRVPTGMIGVISRDRNKILAILPGDYDARWFVYL